MTGNEFLNHVVNGEVDFLALLLKMLEESGTDYCVIGGLAVNAYADPVVSRDLDVVVVSERIEALKKDAASSGLKVENFEHSVIFSLQGSDLRVQLQTDPRYRAFIDRAQAREIPGYRMKVAAVEDVLTGKVRAFSDDSRRGSRRQKDLADIMRLVETHPGLLELVPKSVRSRFLALTPAAATFDPEPPAPRDRLRYGREAVHADNAQHRGVSPHRSAGRHTLSRPEPPQQPGLRQRYFGMDEPVPRSDRLDPG